MSNALRKIINAPIPEPAKETVKWTDKAGETHEINLVVTNDAQNVLDSMLLDEGKKRAFALSYSAVLKTQGIESPISENMVAMIKLVAASIVPDDDAEPITELEIARLSKTHGDLFLALMEAASRLGNMDTIGATFMQVEAGK